MASPATEIDDPDQDPLSVTSDTSIRCRGPEYGYTNTHGKWMIFKNLEDLNDTWCVVREELRSGNLGVIGASCSTLRYDPLRGSGVGPRTTGRISVSTKEHDKMEIGMKLIRLPKVQHDIKYKTMEASKKMQFQHIKNSGRHVPCILYWNNGNPSLERVGPPCPRNCRDDVRAYDPSTDVWKINIVNGCQPHASERANGKWIVVSNYNEESAVNISALWHALKPRVEEGEIPAIRMECPAPRRRGDKKPEIHVFTSDTNMTAVGKKIISLMKEDLTYLVGEGVLERNRKVLYWNHGNPGYDQGPK